MPQSEDLPDEFFVFQEMRHVFEKEGGPKKR